MLREVSSMMPYPVRIIRRSQFRGPISIGGSNWLVEAQPILEFSLATPLSKSSKAQTVDNFVIFTFANIN
jgi:hypothetical protein